MRYPRILNLHLYLISVVIIGILTSQSQAGPSDRAPATRRGDMLDNRFHHGHYYRPRGAFSRTLPRGYVPYYYFGDPFYFHDGIWYRPGAGGFFVVRPPIGIHIRTPPPYYTTVWYGGMPYYYADDTFYQWTAATNAYTVVKSPTSAKASEKAPPSPSPSPAPALPGNKLFIYPNTGQNPEQQSADSFECHTWAKKETGFDPIQPNGGVPIEQNSVRSAGYDRATAACLEARGYSVK